MPVSRFLNGSVFHESPIMPNTRETSVAASCITCMSPIAPAGDRAFLFHADSVSIMAIMVSLATPYLSAISSMNGRYWRIASALPGLSRMLASRSAVTLNSALLSRCAFVCPSVAFVFSNCFCNSASIMASTRCCSLSGISVFFASSMYSFLS